MEWVQGGSFVPEAERSAARVEPRTLDPPQGKIQFPSEESKETHAARLGQIRGPLIGRASGLTDTSGKPARDDPVRVAIRLTRNPRPLTRRSLGRPDRLGTAEVICGRAKILFAPHRLPRVRKPRTAEERATCNS